MDRTLETMRTSETSNLKKNKLRRKEREGELRGNFERAVKCGGQEKNGKTNHSIGQFEHKKLGTPNRWCRAWGERVDSATESERSGSVLRNQKKPTEGGRKKQDGIEIVRLNRI